MSDAERREQVTRDSILKLLSDEENARVSTAETASGLTEGEEYLDLEDLDQGVQRAKASTAKAKMGHVLPRSAVSEETWGKILVQLTDETPMYQTQYPVSAQETVTCGQPYDAFIITLVSSSTSRPTWPSNHCSS